MDWRISLLIGVVGVVVVVIVLGVVWCLIVVLSEFAKQREDEEGEPDGYFDDQW